MSEKERQKRPSGMRDEGTNIIEQAFVVRRKHRKVRTPRSADVQRKGVRVVENGRRNVEEGVRTEKGCRRCDSDHLNEA
jgi:hypothetical protein